MAYKPPKQTIVDNDLQNIPSSEAVFEALKLKVDEPTISGSAGQLLQLDGYVSGEAVTSWVNPPAGYALPSQTGNAEKVLATNGTSEYWAIEGVKTGYPADTVIVGRAKPVSVTGINNILVGTGTGNALTTGTNAVFIGRNAGLVAQTVDGTIAIGSGALDALTTEAVNEGGNIAIGLNAFGALTSSGGSGSGSGNGVAIGRNAGANCTTGSANIFIGGGSGASWTTAQQSVVIGTGAGATGNSQGSILIGYNGGRGITGQGNIVIARNWQNQTILTTGSSNVFIGDVFGYTNATYGIVNLTSGSRNVGLGVEAGFLVNNTTSAIVLGRGAAAGSNEFAVGSSTDQINTVLLGRGGHTQTVANAVKIQTMRGTGTDRDMSVGTLTIAGAQGTGTGAGGDVIIATAAPAVSSGSSLNAHVEVMRVTDNGLVGIGTSTPAEKLEVAGAVLATEYRVPNYRLDPHTHDEGTETTDFTINWSNGVVHTVTLNAAGPLVITMNNPVDGGAYALRIIQGATPGTVTWPANVKWPGGTPPTLSTNTGDVDLVNLLYFDDGGGNTYYYATSALAFA